MYIREEVLNRLGSFGIEPTHEDETALAFAIEKAKRKVLVFCNIKELPEALEPTIIDMASGEFLNIKNQTGGVESLSNFDDDVPIKAFQIGDTNFTFSTEGTLTRQQKLDRLVQFLLYGRVGDLLSYRKLRW